MNIFILLTACNSGLIRTPGNSDFTDSSQHSSLSGGLVSQVWCNKEDSHSLSLYDKHTGTWRNTSSFMSNCTHKYHFNRISTDRANSKIKPLSGTKIILETCVLLVNSSFTIPSAFFHISSLLTLECNHEHTLESVILANIKQS